MIPSKRWFPSGWQERAAWYQNFSTQFSAVGVSLGFTAAEITAVEDDNLVIQFLADTMVEINAFDDAVSFTGSVATGQRVAAACVARMAKFQLEMGGKNPFVVLDDADLGVAVNCAVQSGYFSTGQRCTASSRIIVTEGIHERFVAAMEKVIQDGLPS